MHLRLILRANERSLRFPLGPGEYLIGSAPGCPVHVPHPTVSSRHARLVVGAEGAELEDLGSRNGSLVNLRRVEQPTPLAHGYEVSFGGVSGIVEVVSAGDLEAEVTLPEDFLPEGKTAEDDLLDSTLGVSPPGLSCFMTGHLPPLIGDLLQGADPLEVAQQVGTRAFDAFSIAHLEILRVENEREAVWFSAGSGKADPKKAGSFQADQRGIRLRGQAGSPALARSYGPVFEALAGLIALALPTGRRAGGRLRTLAPQETPPLPSPPTTDPYLQEVYRQAARIARGEISVLIQGESGTGKELLAHYMHACSGRPKEKLFALNCAALPRDLLEMELFGIEKAVATGVDARAGKFELADGGTLFLDEIGDMGVDTQAKILRVLQEQSVYRLGGDRPRPARVRVLAATNRDIEAMVRKETFRQDLYHRIAAWIVELPPLRRRVGDIANLAAHFLAEEASRRGVRIAGISRGAMDELLAHHWPGNVRELRSAMARASLFLDDGDLVESRHLWRTLRRELEGPPRTLKERLIRFEGQQIRRALAAAGNDPEKAATRLGISRATIYRRLKALGLQDAAMAEPKDP